MIHMTKIPKLLEPLMGELIYHRGNLNRKYYNLGYHEINVRLPQYEGYVGAIRLTDTILGYSIFSGAKNSIQQESSFFNTFGYDLEHVRDNDYVYPASKITGTGQPYSANCYDIKTKQSDCDTKTVDIRQVCFLWYDRHLGVSNRDSGPHCVIMNNVSLARDSMFWTSQDTRIPKLDPHSDLHKRMQKLNPFRNPYFSDPQDELQYRLETS